MALTDLAAQATGAAPRNKSREEILAKLRLGRTVGVLVNGEERVVHNESEIPSEAELAIGDPNRERQALSALDQMEQEIQRQRDLLKQSTAARNELSTDANAPIEGAQPLAPAGGEAELNPEPQKTINELQGPSQADLIKEAGLEQVATGVSGTYAAPIESVLTPAETSGAGTTGDDKDSKKKNRNS